MPPLRQRTRAVPQRRLADRPPISSDHVVQLFDTAESLGESVAAFLVEGIGERSPLLLVARPVHVQAISGALAARGVSIVELLETGQLTVLDANGLLRQILSDGVPDAARFDRVVGDAVRRLASSGARVHIYGEMVDILAEEMEFSAVAILEDLWNGLSATVPFALLCGYASAHFTASGAADLLRDICAQHGKVSEAHADILGSWVLANHQALPQT